MNKFIYKTATYIAKTKSDIKNQIYWYNKGRLLKKRILEFYSKQPASDEESEVVEYLKYSRISLLPYNFTRQYKSKHVTVKYEQESGFSYVEVDKKRLYYRRDWSRREIKKYHANLLAEQDSESPHFYPIESLVQKRLRTVIDAGGAEGIFALLLIDKVDFIYIIEPNPNWVEALIKTFSPWKDKVYIVTKYLSDTTAQDSITIDQYFEEKEIDLIKIDVEGYERQVLKGGRKLLSRNQNLKLIVAAYHGQDDERVLKNMLVQYGFDTSYSKGFILFFYDIEIDYPLMRRGLIYANKEGKTEINSVT